MGENKHPSIFFHLSNSGLKLSRGERQSTPWKGHQSITGLTHGERQPFTPSVNLELPINLTPRMFLDCRRKPECSEKTYTETGRRWKFHNKSLNFFEVVLKLLKLFFSKMEMKIGNKFWVRWQKLCLVAKIRWWVILSAIVHLSVSVSENMC